MHKLINEYNCQVRTVILGEGITSRSNERKLFIGSTNAYFLLAIIIPFMGFELINLL